MNRPLSVAGLIIALWFSLSPTRICWAEDNQVKIGFLANRGSERCMEKWSPTAAYLTTRIPGRTFVIVPIDFDGIYSAVEITRVSYAIAFLGLNQLHRMVLPLSVINTLDVHDKDELHGFWFHSFYTAISTKYLARKYEPLLSYEELWSAAMLHDIGKLVYLKFFPDHYRALRDFCNEHGRLFSEAEKHFSLPSSAY